MSARDFEKDYYKALGVTKDTPVADIKKAYRKLARKHHPDANKGDAAAEERFKEISEAYDVLSDPTRRAEYDEQRSLFAGGGYRPGGGSPNGGFNVDFGDLFRDGGGGGGGLGDMFGGLFGGAGGRGRERGPRRGADIESEVTLEFVDAVHGVTLPLRLNTPHTCRACAGTGGEGGRTRLCPTCGGSGNTVRSQGGFGFAEPCRDCRGTGRLIDTPCPECRGSGQITSERTITVRVPEGVKDGQRIRLAGKGMPGGSGAPAGDLFVVVHVRPHRVFGRKGDHITVSVPVTFPEAALGAEVPVPTLDGSVTLRIPAGTSSGRTFRVKGRGVPKRAGGAGDLLATVEVAVPTKLSAEGKKALEMFAAAEDADPRAELTEEARRG